MVNADPMHCLHRWKKVITRHPPDMSCDQVTNMAPADLIESFCLGCGVELFDYREMVTLHLGMAARNPDAVFLDERRVTE